MNIANRQADGNIIVLKTNSANNKSACGMVDNRGNTFIPVEYESVTLIYDLNGVRRENGSVGLMDKNGI